MNIVPVPLFLSTQNYRTVRSILRLPYLINDVVPVSVIDYTGVVFLLLLAEGQIPIANRVRVDAYSQHTTTLEIQMAGNCQYAGL